ncbi:hypothetical protein OVA03_04720 [Asticcacaulis sp. SL142]|uniref:tetratricopeptide repeat protein n=1 Tax=Asticcacaulis sp. SL142 TaxID=2995155 RepID=UPI00226C6622|nr:hypothetical protein [Asticcacaulis sp. SL142]WAC49213.1 hypothetical protein OVA03_04720 [Asticcacaulis sp. SL142]
MSFLRGILFLLAIHGLASPALAQIYPKEYIKNLRTKANDGDPKSQYGLAIYSLNENKPKEAWKWLNKSAENGYAEAQLKMGDYYKDGLLIGYGQLTVAIDLEKSLEWYKRAADQNHLGATENICALRSRGPAQNLSEAITYCRASSQKGRHNGYFY